jgi:hypothetical protein
MSSGLDTFPNIYDTSYLCTNVHSETKNLGPTVADTAHTPPLPPTYTHLQNNFLLSSVCPFILDEFLHAKAKSMSWQVSCFESTRQFLFDLGNKPVLTSSGFWTVLVLVLVPSSTTRLPGLPAAKFWMFFCFFFVFQNWNWELGTGNFGN